MINIEEINPIDYYNINHVQDALNVLLDLPNVESTGIDSVTYIQNQSDKTKKMIVIKNARFIPKISNGLYLTVDYEYTPFMMLQKFKFKDNFTQALHYVMTDKMGIETKYVRVGFKYFKNIITVDRYGIERSSLKLWDKYALTDDFGKQALGNVLKYDDFTLLPDNKNYVDVFKGNYNLYSKFSHIENTSEFNPLNTVWTLNLLKHIFGEQFEHGITYIKTLYDYPKQALPILVLVSEERMTGKTTLIDWFSVLFGANMVVINPQDIGSSFNSSYADKNVIAIEESRFDGIQSTEKLKNLATQKKIMVNAKYTSPYSIPFYGKLIITSNDESKFSKVDSEEIRYWVRKIPSLTGKANHTILDTLVKEIPYFLQYLSALPDIDTTKSRMVFDADEIKTDALESVKAESLPGLHKELNELFDEYGMNNPDRKEFLFTPIMIKKMWFERNSKIEIHYINRILKDSMKLSRLKMQRFVPLNAIDQYSAKVSGRPYSIQNKHYSNLI